jgi:hypothetical protein
MTLIELTISTAVGIVVIGTAMHHYLRYQADHNSAYAATWVGTPVTVHGKLYYGLTPAGRIVVDVHEKVHQQQGFFDPYNFGEADIELPAYQADRNYARYLLGVGKLTDAERKEVLDMIDESNWYIHHFAAVLGVDAK